jgi:hypothetical protein
MTTWFRHSLFLEFLEIFLNPVYTYILQTPGILARSIIHKYSPSTLHNTWVFNYERNPDRELRNANDIYVPLANSIPVKKMPYFAISTMWNNLPYDRMQPNPTTFRIALNDHFWNLLTTNN